MPTTSANVLQTAVSGKFARVFLFSAAGGGTSPGAVNFKKATVTPKVTDLDTTGWEDAGFGNGLTGINRLDLSLEGPYQILRSGAVAPYTSIILPGTIFVFQIYTVHPDYGNAGDFHRFTGVAQVIEFPVDLETDREHQNTIRASSRGRFYFPGDTLVPTVSALLANFTGIAT